jgi:hypothetical protein
VQHPSAELPCPGETDLERTQAGRNAGHPALYLCDPSFISFAQKFNGNMEIVGTDPTNTGLWVPPAQFTYPGSRGLSNFIRNIYRQKYSFH